MAVACVEETEFERQLNETLSGLRSTSKGQLKYNGDRNFNVDDSDELDCTLETYLSHVSHESIRLISNISFEFKIDDASITNKELGQGDDTRSDETASTLDRKSFNSTRSSPVMIAPNFESSYEFTIKEYHEETRELSGKMKEMRTKVFKRRAQNFRNESNWFRESKLRELNAENERIRNELFQREQKEYEEMKRKREELDKEAKEHKKKLDDILRKAIIEESHLAKEEEQRKEAMENMKKNITSLYHQLLYNIDVIQKKFKDFPYMSFVAGETYQGVTGSLSRVITKAEAVFKKSESMNDLSVAEDCLKDMVMLLEQMGSIEKNVGIILKMAEDSAMRKKNDLEVARAKQEELKKQHEETIQKNIVQKSADKLPLSIDKKLTSLTSTVQGLEEAKCISNDAFSQYFKLQEMLKKTQDSFKEFSTDPKYTKYKFDLHKAVNVPINALSAHSPSHLNDKILRLVSLLAGQNVTVGGKTVNCNSHPSALAFCKHLVAKKLVMQGAQQVSSSPSSAFIYAAVIVGIWSAFPDVGQLILAHFHLTYPYLVPYYMPMEDGQSNNDYHKTLGYSIVQDKIEDQDKFLKKFSGTVQLYAAVVTSSGSDQSDHPHGVQQGWTWLVRVLNLKPHPSVTATMLYHFISVSGHVLMKKYGRQFQKILLVLCKDFVPILDKVTPPGKRGPTQRLKDFLEDCLKMKRIPEPEGYLTERWWHSGNF